MPRSLVSHLRNAVAEHEKKTTPEKQLQEYLSEPLLKAVSNTGTLKKSSWAQDQRQLLYSIFLFRPNLLPSPFSNTSRKQAEHIITQMPLSAPVSFLSIPEVFANFLLTNYTTYHLPQYPCVSKILLVESFNKIFVTKKECTAYDYITVSLAMAISASTLLWKNERAAVASSNALFTTAAQHLSDLDWEDSTETLAIILLFSHYSYANPVACDTWFLMGMALRMSFSLGLHRDMPEENLNALEIDTRRRLFLMTSSMERALCSLHLKPTFLSDQYITSLDPSPLGDEFISAQGLDESGVQYKGAALHFHKHRLLQSEMFDVLWKGRLDPKIKLEDWMEDMDQRMTQWYFDAAPFTKIHQLKFREINKVQGSLRLKRRSPYYTDPILKHRIDLYYDIKRLISINQDLFSSGHLSYLLYGVHFMVESAVCLLEMMWNQLELVINTFSFQEVHNVFRSCLEVITRMSSRWPAAQYCVTVLSDLEYEVAAFKYPSALSQKVAKDRDEQDISDQIFNLLFPDSHYEVAQESENKDVQFFDTNELGWDIEFETVINWNEDWALSNIILD